MSEDSGRSGAQAGGTPDAQADGTQAEAAQSDPGKPDPGKPDSGKPDPGKPQRPAWLEYFVTVVVALLVLGLVNTFVGRLYQIPSESMEPTLVGCDGCTGDRIVVDKLTYRFSEPAAGDVVVFSAPAGWEDGWTSGRSGNPVIRFGQEVLSTVGILPPDEYTLVKRVVATGGQTVQCRQGDPGIMVDGKKVDDSYTLSPRAYPVDPMTGSDACQGEYFGPVTVPDNALWVMGDNRTNSRDSRYHLNDPDKGSVPVDNVIGKARFKVWPVSRIGTVD
ncbi:signal peptidase I [Corynebacterium neomassiliense]|uniref:signal peptidase I n=1 Tax=Corynebacterium neomassiliense TaxID=2079482 RepID=UPI001F018D79|nr:signal peptidase I [Corynebacterium neomassiliense]